MQAAGSSPLVALLKAQGLSPLMRQYIMYAVAMADSDQEALLTQQINSTAHAEAAATTQPPLQSGTNAKPATNIALLSPSSSHSTSQAASQTATAQQPESRSSAGGLDAVSEACRPISHAQSHAPAAVEPASGADSDPQPPPDIPTPSSLEGSPSCIASSASPQSESQPVAAGILSDSLMSVEEGLKALRQYLSSVGRYGANSGAFLTPMYGCAELPQAFCSWEGISCVSSALLRHSALVRLCAGLLCCICPHVVVPVFCVHVRFMSLCSTGVSKPC